MKPSDINPHIRYFSIHHTHINRPFDSICYDCRLFFVKKGEGIISVNNVEYHYTNNTILFFPPGTRYHFHINKDCCEIALIVVNFDLVNDFSHLTKSLGTASVQNFHPEQVLRYELPKEYDTVLIKNIPNLSDPLTRCADEFLMQNNLYREASSAILKLCLIEMIRYNSLEEDMKKVTPILNYIHANYHNADLTNDDIAKLFNYHPYYLSRMIKQCTGKTLHQYLIEYRIKMAQKNLITTDDSINTIAWKSGFHSVAYFIKMFKEHVGITPKAYRREHIQLLL